MQPLDDYNLRLRSIEPGVESRSIRCGGAAATASILDSVALPRLSDVHLISFLHSHFQGNHVFRMLLAWIVSTLLFANFLTAEELPEPQRQEIIRIVEALQQQSSAPGISVAIGLEDSVCFAQGFGSADLENNVAVTPETRFRTASIAKPMTAVLVMRLAAEGNLDLDADIRSYVPEYPEKRWTFNCRQLLGHLAGVRHYKNDAETRSTDAYYNLTDAMETFRDDPLLHEPGSQYRYTTFGYNLLGNIAEAAGEDTFLNLLQKRVFDPAGMESTLDDSQAKIIPHRSRGYFKATLPYVLRSPAGHPFRVGEIYNAPFHDTSVKIPGGGLLSTPSDLVRFTIAVDECTICDEPSQRAMWTVQTTTTGTPTNYGLGWGVGSHHGQPMISHTGGQVGTSTVLVLFPDANVSVAIMCNLQSVSLKKTAIDIADVVLAAAPSEAGTRE